MGLKMSNNMREALEREKNSYFKPAGDLDDEYSFTNDAEKERYLRSIASGVRYDEMECGSAIFPFDRVVSMVNEGYNIVTASYLGNDLVSVEFEKMNDVKRNGR